MDIGLIGAMILEPGSVLMALCASRDNPRGLDGRGGNEGLSLLALCDDDDILKREATVKVMFVDVCCPPAARLIRVEQQVLGAKWIEEGEEVTARRNDLEEKKSG